jgi:hypothetical protein
MKSADVDYIWQADACGRLKQAYQHLRLEKRPVPTFYGAWNFELPKDHPDESDKQRPVYLILIQYVEGKSVRGYLKESEGDETEDKESEPPRVHTPRQMHWPHPERFVAMTVK